jgi:hypothetical protein
MGAHRKLLYTLALLLISTISVSASPLNCKLLSLVPPGSGIVAGFENYSDPHRHGQLLLSTHSDRVDLADWLAIAGVDSKRSFDEGVEVASASAEGELPTEHLLLIAGQFDKDRIYGAAEQNGAQRSAYDGETVMLIQPFTREKGEMQDLRWLLIVENRIGIFGTPFLVQQALHRYQTHADVDRLLKERLSQLPHDVRSWNVLISTTDRKSLNMHEGSRWAGLVEEAEVLIVGARFGPKVRVDFLLHANSIHGAGFFQQKVSSFAQVFAGVLPNGSEERRLAKVSLEPDRVRGSIELSKRQFQMWCEQGSLDQGLQAARPMSPGE